MSDYDVLKRTNERMEDGDTKAICWWDYYEAATTRIADLEARLARACDDWEVSLNQRDEALKELHEWIGWAQSALKTIKGNKIVHGSLGGELDLAISELLKKKNEALAEVERLTRELNNLRRGRKADDGEER